MKLGQFVVILSCLNHNWAFSFMDHHVTFFCCNDFRHISGTRSVNPVRRRNQRVVRRFQRRKMASRRNRDVKSCPRPLFRLVKGRILRERNLKLTLDGNYYHKFETLLKIAKKFF